MIMETLEHFVTTGIVEGKQRQKMLDGLIKWLNVEQVTDAPSDEG